MSLTTQQMIAITTTGLSNRIANNRVQPSPVLDADEFDAYEGIVDAASLSAKTARFGDVSLTWSITGGADAARFAIDASTGVMVFVNEPDYASPADADTDNDYVVQVTCSDGQGGSSTTTVTITVNAATLTDTDGDANEIEGDAAEDDAVAGITLSCSLPATVTYSLIDDAGGRFKINSSTGAVSRTDSGELTEATYNITIRAASSATAATAELTLPITVTNPEPVPSIVVAPVISGPTANQLTVNTGEWSPTPSGYSYKWQTSADGETGWADSGDTSATLDIDAATFWRAGVAATNASGTSDYVFTDPIEIEGGEVLGAEEWPDPTCDSWAAISTADANWGLSSGTYTSDGGDGAIGVTGGSAPLTIGRTYRATVDITSHSAGTLYFGWDGNASLAGGVSSTGQHSRDFVATAAALYLYSSSWNGALTSYSVKEVTTEYTEASGDPPAEPGPESTGPADMTDWLDEFYPSRPYTADNAVRTQSVGALYPSDVRTNWRVGSSSNYTVSHKFTAWASGALSACRMEWGAGSGYAAGDGGLIRCRVYPDDGTGKPNMAGTLHAEFTFDPPMSGGNWTDGGNYYRNHTFTSYVDLVAGTAYHAVFQNIHASPASNWISTQAHTLMADSYSAFHSDDYEASPVMRSRDWVLLYSSNGGTTWSTYNDSYATLCPIMQLTIGGEAWGVSYEMAGNWQGPPDRTFVRTATNIWRTEIVPDTTRTWYGLIEAVNCKVAGDFDWTLKTAAGTTLASGTVTMSTADDVDESHDTNVWKFDDWVPMWFGAGVVLTAGQTYYLERVPQGSAQFRVCAQGDGRGEGFTGSTHTEIRAQHYDGSTWRYAVPYSHTTSANVTHWRELYRTS